MRLSGHEATKNGVIVSKTKLRESIDNCNKRIGKALYKLYDMGYISSATVYDEKSVIHSLFQEFADDVNLLSSNIEGSLQLTSLRMKYAKVVSKNESFRTVIEVLYEYYINTENLSALEKTLQSSLLKSESDLVNVNPKVLVSDCAIKYRCPLAFDNKAVRDCLLPVSSGGTTYSLVEYDMSDIIMESLCDYLGLDSNVFDEAKRTNTSIFFDGITLTEEIEFLPLLTSGDIELETANGKLLEESVFKYYRDTSEVIGSAYDRQSYQDLVYIHCFKKRMSYVSSVRQGLPSGSTKEFLVTQNSIIFAVRDNVQKTEVKTFDWGIVGNYVLDWSKGEEMDKVNNLLGVSGEFVAEKNCRKLGLKRSGVPTMLKSLSVSDGNIVVTEEPYYKISQLKTRDDGDVSPLVGGEFHFVFTDISTVYKRYSTDSNGLRDVLEHRFKPMFTVDDVSKYTSLVADLCLALIMMDCGYPDYTSSITDKSFITEDLFYKACYEAERLFNVIMN